MRQMVYTTNDIAYLQDIEALNKKIEALAEQSHSNDIQTFCMQDEMREEFATVDEVNTVLTNYVQKKDLPPAVDMSEYYNKIESDNKYALKSDVVKQLRTTKNITLNSEEADENTLYLRTLWDTYGEKCLKQSPIHLTMEPTSDGKDLSGDYYLTSQLILENNDRKIVTMVDRFTGPGIGNTYSN